MFTKDPKGVLLVNTPSPVLLCCRSSKHPEEGYINKLGFGF